MLFIFEKNIKRIYPLGVLTKKKIIIINNGRRERKKKNKNKNKIKRRKLKNWKVGDIGKKQKGNQHLSNY
jgi:hypothetical protein